MRQCSTRSRCLRNLVYWGSQYFVACGKRAVLGWHFRVIGEHRQLATANCPPPAQFAPVPVAISPIPPEALER